MLPHSSKVGLMADLNNDLRLTVDTGKVSLGHRETLRALSDNRAKAIVVAEKGRKDSVDDVVHLCNVSGTRLITFKGSSMELGAVCGKPYSVNSLAILEPGNSGILNEEYNQ